MALVEHLAGKVVSPKSSGYLEQFHMRRDDILLCLDLTDLQVTKKGSNHHSITDVGVGKLTFGYASEPILSFDSKLKMRESVKDLESLAGKDIFCSITGSGDSTHINVNTLPVRIALNLQRLDETFSWFGGFSGILELGSSIASMSTIVGAKQSSAVSKLPKKPKGVHFAQEPASDDAMAGSMLLQGKTNARVGGLTIDLIGKDCSVGLETSAVKIVNRTEGVGLQIDNARFGGPYIHSQSHQPAVTVDLSNIRIEYLFTPKEVDLDRLLSLLTPSKDKYDPDDDIMLDTLFRQRRQGGVLRINLAKMKAKAAKLAELQYLTPLSAELSKLSTVAKYLPEDDRPGVMTLALVKQADISVAVGDQIGVVQLVSSNLELAHIGIPSLIATKVEKASLYRNGEEELLGEASPHGTAAGLTPLPMLMARFIADEMEPTIKVKLCNIRLEYTVPAVMALLGLTDEKMAEDLAMDMVNSVIDMGGRHGMSKPPQLLSRSSSSSENSNKMTGPLKVEIVLRDSLVGLNPRDLPCKGLLVLTDVRFYGALPKEGVVDARLEIKKASLLIIDDVKHIGSTEVASRRKSAEHQSNLVQDLSETGYVSVAYMSSAMAVLKIMQLENEGPQSIDLEVRDDLFVMETCADSTQTLLSILNGLKPPTPPSTEAKYRTEVMPINNLLESLTGDDFTSLQRGNPSAPLDYEEGDLIDDDLPQNLEFVSEFYPAGPSLASSHVPDDVVDSMLEENLDEIASPSRTRQIGDSNLLRSFREQVEIAPGVEELNFQEDHFAADTAVGGTAHRWDSGQNTYGLNNQSKLRASPLRVRVRDVHFIWNLFDGYDWQNTRDTISKAVKEVEVRAMERRSSRRVSRNLEEEDDSVIGDFLFNSIYIGIPANKDPRELSSNINRNVDELASETGSYATSTTTGSPNRQGGGHRVKGRKLRLNRSKTHKMTFELKGVSVDLVVFPPDSGETQSSIDVRIKDLEIFDHVPTSTWKKFATYMYDAGERESGTSMVHLEILTVRPVQDLAASELVLKVTILPLRLHVDQDALDFLTRFFEFKDDTIPVHTSKADVPFLQRVEVNAVPLKLDFKPKRVDYGGLRSGHTTEFMNFFILDQADMVLRHVIIYGVSGFDKLGKTLNDIWMPDVKNNQLPGVLAGLAPVRSLVNVGSGVRDLVVVPMREYRKDGRVVRSIQKGALAFAKTTTNELVRLGAKLAIGTQTVLQGAEDFLNKPQGQGSEPRWDDSELEEEEKKQISLYADQPVGVVQGLRGAYASLERDLLLARDAIVAVPGEVIESGSAGGAAKAVLRRAPTVIFRPAIGASKAVGQTLLGAGNTLDPTNRRRVDDVGFSGLQLAMRTEYRIGPLTLLSQKYKRH